MDWQDQAKRLLGSRTIHLEGDGPFAFVTPCRNRAFTLWATRAEAEQALKSIRSCGSDCQGATAHYIVDLGSRADRFPLDSTPAAPTPIVGLQSSQTIAV